MLFANHHAETNFARLPAPQRDSYRAMQFEVTNTGNRFFNTWISAPPKSSPREKIIKGLAVVLQVAEVRRVRFVVRHALAPLHLLSAHGMRVQADG
jgi:hypothetical protein